jgi:hypothetical protein
MSDERDPQHLADEARKLIALAQDWAKRTIPEHTGPECQWCPLCQFAALLRGDHPEVGERITEAGNAVAGAVRSLLDAAARQADRASEQPRRPRPGPGRPASPGPSERASRVQHIRLVDET